MKGEVITVEVTIKGEPKEIADLVQRIQSQQHRVSVDCTNRNAYDSVIKNNHIRKTGNSCGRC